MNTRNAKSRQSNHIRAFLYLHIQIPRDDTNLHADAMLGLGSGETEKVELPCEPQNVNEKATFDEVDALLGLGSVASSEEDDSPTTATTTPTTGETGATGETGETGAKSSTSDQGSDQGLDQTFQVKWTSTLTVEWSGPIEYLAGFSTPANLGVTCFFNATLVAMYQSFRNDPKYWQPTSTVGQEIRKILRTMGMPQVDHRIMHERSIRWVLEQLHIPYNQQHAFDETWLLIMEHFSDGPMVTTKMSISCVVCNTKATTDDYPSCLLRLPVPVAAELVSVSLQDLLKPNSNSGRWRCGHHKCHIAPEDCDGNCGGEQCVANTHPTFEYAQVCTEIVNLPSEFFFTVSGVGRRDEEENDLARAGISCDEVVTVKGSQYRLRLVVFHTASASAEEDDTITASNEGSEHGHYYSVVVDGPNLILHDDSRQRTVERSFIDRREKKVMGGFYEIITGSSAASTASSTKMPNPLSSVGELTNLDAEKKPKRKGFDDVSESFGVKKTRIREDAQVAREFVEPIKKTRIREDAQAAIQDGANKTEFERIGTPNYDFSITPANKRVCEREEIVIVCVRGGRGGRGGGDRFVPLRCAGESGLCYKEQTQICQVKNLRLVRH